MTQRGPRRRCITPNQSPIALYTQSRTLSDRRATVVCRLLTALNHVHRHQLSPTTVACLSQSATLNVHWSNVVSPQFGSFAAWNESREACIPQGSLAPSVQPFRYTVMKGLLQTHTDRHGSVARASMASRG